jgi:Icc-related predicted phosphoesterase
VPPTPFPWSFDLSEDMAADKLESCPDGAILVVHSPPKGHVDEVHGRHLGSESILAAIERTRPRLALCGHIHQCWGGEAAIGTTPVVNLGPDGRFFDI